MTNPYDPTYVPQAVDFQAQTDNEHLKILKICGYIWAGLITLGSIFPMIYVGFGILILNVSSKKIAHPATFHSGSPGEDALMGWIFIGIGCCITLMMLATAFLAFMAARSIGQRRRFVLIMISACLSCLSIPLGTALGIFTFVVLLRPSVRAQFAR